MWATMKTISPMGHSRSGCGSGSPPQTPPANSTRSSLTRAFVYSFSKRFVSLVKERRRLPNARFFHYSRDHKHPSSLHCVDFKSIKERERKKERRRLHFSRYPYWINELIFTSITCSRNEFSVFRWRKISRYDEPVLLSKKRKTESNGERGESVYTYGLTFFLTSCKLCYDSRFTLYKGLINLFVLYICSAQLTGRSVPFSELM